MGVHPIVYPQLTNKEFIAESISLIGGLLIMRGHLMLQEHKTRKQKSAKSELAQHWPEKLALLRGSFAPEDETAQVVPRAARTQLLGRVLLPTLYVFHAGATIAANLANFEHQQDHSLLN